MVLPLQISGLPTIINGFLCEYELLPGECLIDCEKCNHAKDYQSGGHPGDRRLEDEKRYDGFSG